ncbi:related to RTT107-Establishes Silent Chromatin [Rhynchosporium secalis]|uniref:Related to RTT107-Establishes Silent Chromatin n=1 Tax=Rhynchosporium secalis TaxID=38038 RepID=A0A1E1M376_RHYSE|nr:related to RTT107-Establishes Silent Chromatin [Rhynchosporium secalis]
MADAKIDKLFENCIFGIVVNKTLSRDQALELKEVIESHSGEVADLDETFDITYVTHIISATSDFPQYADSRQYMLPVITPAWVTQSLLKGKDAPMRAYTPDPNHIFAGVTISCADIPNGDKDAIIGAVLAMGGMETNNLTRTTTHICALTVDHPKCVSAKDKGLKCVIVLPHWFDDCLKLGKRIDEKPYLLPDPEIFSLKPEADLAMQSSASIHGASSARPESLALDTGSPVRPLTVFKHKKVMISKDLELGNRTLKVIDDLIMKGGGNMTASVHNADMYICHYREGREYIFASRALIDVGNLSWLYFLIANNEWTSPLRRLLHYPVPKNGIPGFENLRITLSNYGGEARTYLENLVTACGAEFTKSMKQDNTHLITARNGSEKCDAAKEWNIEMVNHLWIEESYAKCAMQKLTTAKYMHFPSRTNLGEIIGETRFEAAILEEKYFPRDPTASPGDPQPSMRRVMHEKDRNCSPRKSNGDTTMGGQSGDDSPVKPARKGPAARRAKSLGVAPPATPAAKRRASAGKENDTPISTGSRSAKDKAMSRLNQIAPDIALYEKEKKRKGSVWGGERAANNYEKLKSTERSSSPLQKKAEEEFSEDDAVEEETRNAKRQKTGLPPANIRLLITGYKGWVGNITKEDSDKKKLRDLGVLVITDPLKCTHLAAPAVVRTQKFLCALATGPVIVDSSYIDQCVQTRKLPKVEDFLLRDMENEKRFGVKLKDVIARAKVNKRGLLRRVPIYCTPKIDNPTIYQSIVEANGGTFAPYRGRPTIKKITAEEDDGPAEPVYLLSGEHPEERKLWPKFEEMARDGNMIPRIVPVEWLLDVAMAQQHKWSDKFLVSRN